MLLYGGDRGEGQADRWRPSVSSGTVSLVLAVAIVVLGSGPLLAATLCSWGYDAYGQLGGGALVDQPLPVYAKGPGGLGNLGDLLAVSAGGWHTVVLRSDGSVWAWGYSADGQIGNGTGGRPVLAPVKVRGLATAVHIPAGSSHDLALADAVRNGDWQSTADASPSAAGSVSKGPNLPYFNDKQLVSLSGSPAASQAFKNLMGLPVEATVTANGGQSVATLTITTSTPVRDILEPPVASQVLFWGSTNTRWPHSVKQSDGSDLDTATMVSAGYNHRAALLSDGTVRCWGNNQYSQIGDGTNATSRPYPTQVKRDAATPLTGIRAVAASHSNEYSGSCTLAVGTDGSAWAWGCGNYGQLGTGSVSNSPWAVRVKSSSTTNLSGVVAMAAGNAHSMALLTDGSVWCWGKGTGGQLGNGVSANSPYPVQVRLSTGATLSGVVAIAAGNSHSLALKSNGTVWAWGYNGAGELGDGTLITRNAAVQVKDGLSGGMLTGMKAIAAGWGFSLALATDGTVRSWGSNYYGQLGTGNNVTAPAAVKVLGLGGSGVLGDIVAIAAGSWHSLAIRSDGTALGWGHNSSCQLGDSTYTTTNSPVAVVAARNIAAISACDNYSLAIGQLYQSTLTLSADPPSNGTAVASPSGPSYDYDQLVTIQARPTAGSFFMGWSGLEGVTVQLSGGSTSGAGSTVSFNIHTDLTVVAMFAAARPTVTARAWPAGAASATVSPSPGTYDLGTTVTLTAGSPAEGYAFSHWVGLPSGYSSGGASTEATVTFQVADNVAAAACFRSTVAGTVLAWGHNDEGQLGSGTTSDSSLALPSCGPLGAGFMTDAIFVAAGDLHSWAIRSDGTVWAWGRNDEGQLGDASMTNRLLPVQVKGPYGEGYLGDAAAVAVGGQFCLVLRKDGTVWACGYNYYGQLGGSLYMSMSSLQPVRGLGGVGYLNGVVAIAAGYSHALALRSDGSVWAWGQNYDGSLGDASHVSKQIYPVQVRAPDGPAYLSQIVAIDAGVYYSLALRADGTAWVWGRDVAAPLSNQNRSLPVQVTSAPGGLPLTGISAIAAGSDHCLALGADGTVWAWGDNSYGALGWGTPTSSHYEVEAVCDAAGVPLQGITAISAGDDFSLALGGHGQVWAWGRNDCGQLGDATLRARTSPVALKATVTVQALAAGWTHSLAIGQVPNRHLTLTADPPQGGVVTRQPTGDEFFYGTLVTLTVAPVPGWMLTGLSGLPSGILAAGTSGSGAAVSFNIMDDLTITGRFAPAQFQVTARACPAAGGVVSVAPAQSSYGYQESVTMEAQAAPGYRFSHWIGLPSGALSGVGSGLGSGAVGTVTFNVTDNVTATAMFICQPEAGSRVLACGNNYNYQLGDSTARNSPILVPTRDSSGTGYLADIVGLAAGREHSLALSASGQVWAWGYNDHYQLGNGTIGAELLPHYVAGRGGAGTLGGIVAVAAGECHSLALATDGTVWTWGSNSNGQLGIGTTSSASTPVPVVGPKALGLLQNIVAIAAGQTHSLALRSDGTVWAWGSNSYGQIGSGDTYDYLVPVQVVGPLGQGFLTDIVAIGTGCSHGLALRSDSTVWAWGSNDHGQLGDGSCISRSTPVQVRGLDGNGYLGNVEAITAGGYHGLALLRDGTTCAWGYNNCGQLGVGARGDHNSPVAVKASSGTGALSGATTVCGGRIFSAAIMSDGTLRCWGDNGYGELGDGTTTSRTLPVRTLGAVKVTAVSSSTHMLVLGLLGRQSLETFAAPSQAGTVARTPDQADYDFNSTVTLRSTPAEGWLFMGWSGVGTGARNAGYSGLGSGLGGTLTFDIVDSLAVTANFQLRTWHLGYSVAAGGAIIGDPQGDYPHGTTVHLEAAAAPGYRFLKWQHGGQDLPGGPQLDLVMTADRTVQALFVYQLTLTVVNGTGSGAYDEGAIVNIAATIPPGQLFDGWTGDVSTVADVATARTTITINASYTVTANFKAEPPPVLTVDLELDRKWVYQNTPATTGDRHVRWLTVHITGGAGVPADYTFELEKSGPGDVMIEATDEMTVWKIRGGRRQPDGILGSGAVELAVTATSTDGPVATATAEMTVRQLGDIDGVGGVNGQDKLMMNKRLNGLLPNGPEYDLDGVGGCSGQDKLVLNKILNGMAIP